MKTISALNFGPEGREIPSFFRAISIGLTGKSVTTLMSAPDGELNRYCSPHSLLVYVEEKGLRRIRCPFEVQCIRPIGPFEEGEVLKVRKILVTSGHRLAYQIRGVGYPFQHFRIRL